MNANPNKRQRQPALLGDHPPEYGKNACGGTHINLLANRGVNVKMTSNWGAFITVAARWCCVDVNLKGSYNATCTVTSTQPPYNDKNPQCFLSTKIFIPFSNLSVRVTSHGRRPRPRLLIDSSFNTDSTGVSYLRPALSELSSVVSLPEQM